VHVSRLSAAVFEDGIHHPYRSRLGFLGLGAQPPTPEWGAIVSDGRSYLVDQWWISTFPGLFIALVVLGFNLLGDGIRDIMDPRIRR